MRIIHYSVFLTAAMQEFEDFEQRSTVKNFTKFCSYKYDAATSWWTTTATGGRLCKRNFKEKGAKAILQTQPTAYWSARTSTDSNSVQCHKIKADSSTSNFLEWGNKVYTQHGFHGCM